MLKKLRLKDFKSFVDEQVELAPLTLLVGANASGKSNFLDAIRFLHGLSLDLSLAEILDGQQSSASNAWRGLRGGALEAARFGAASFTVESEWTVAPIDLPHSRSEYNFAHRLVCRTSPQPLLKAEDLSNLSIALKSISLLAIRPEAMRGYGRREGPLGPEGQNFSGVLARLCDDLSSKQSLVDWIAEFCASEIADIDFVGGKELGDVMAIFVEKGGKRISARSISDGTLHFLGILLALKTAEPGSVILIEYIDTGMHPTRLRLLVEYLQSVTRKREIQVIATTHSPVLFPWLDPENLRDVIVFGRVPDQEGTLMRRLGDIPHFEEVIQRTVPDELFHTGWLEMAL